MKENTIVEEQITAIATNAAEEAYVAFSVLSDIKIDKFIKTLYDGTKYLPWSSAWGLVKEHFPTANYRIIENDVGWNFHVANGEGYVKVGVTIQGLEHIVTRPIYGSKNASKKVDQITQADVNKAQQRALTKACAMHGLGLQLWSAADEIDWSCGDAVIASTTQPKRQAKTVKNTTLQSAQAQAAKPQTVPQPKTAPAPVQEQAPAPQAQTTVEAPAQTTPEVSGTEPISITCLGDGLTMKISTDNDPLTFPQFADAILPQKALTMDFHMSDKKMSEFNTDTNGNPRTVQSVMKEIFESFDVAKLHLLSNYIKNQTSDSPVKLPEEDVLTLKAISSLMHSKLSRQSVQTQQI